MYIISRVKGKVVSGSKIVSGNVVSGSKYIAKTVYNKDNVMTGLAYTGLGLYVGFCIFIFAYGIDNTMKQNKLVRNQLRSFNP